MANSEFLQIASYANATEAEQVRGVLEDHGVSAFVDGANASTALSYVGSALGGVKVFVRAVDIEKATEILSSFEQEPEELGEAWFCGKCKEEVDGSFHVCWSCGSAREDVEQPFPVLAPKEEENSIPTVPDQTSSAPVESPDLSDYDHSNPFASPRAGSEIGPLEKRPPEEQPIDINPEAERMLLQAWRASLIGLVLCPPLLNIYSMVLLFRAALSASNFSPKGRRRFYGAFAMNVFSGIAWGTFYNLINFHGGPYP